MTGIIKRLQAIAMGDVAIGSNLQRPLLSEISVEEDRYIEHPISTQYCMTVRMGTIFTSNRAQFSRAHENAQQMIARELYKDVHVLIPQIRGALYAEDINRAHKLIDKMQREIDD
jgi:predicted RNA-binding protein with PIN domain